jgi:hypothetical protein
VDFKVPMREFRVTVALAEAEPLEYVVFLSSFSHRHSGYETIDEYLNTPREFFPMLCDGVPKIVNRRQILWVSTASDGESNYTPDESRVILELIDGLRVEGCLDVDRPIGQARVSDILNDPREEFVCVQDENICYFVNKRSIRQVIVR